MSLGCWDRCRCYRHCGTKSRSTGWRDSEGTGIVPWAGRRDWATRVSGSDAPASRGPDIGKWTKNFRCFRFPKTTVDIFFLQIVPINLTVSPATSDRMRV